MNRIKFIAYNGAYPNLCSGTLIMEVDGKFTKFPSYCLTSGGSAGFTEDWEDVVTHDDWKIDKWPEDFPEELKQEAIDIVNANVEYGCCGGCL